MKGIPGAAWACCVILAASCGTNPPVSSTPPPPPPVVSAAPIPPTSAGPLPCPGGAPFEPDAGCTYQADGTPSPVPAAPIVAVPESPLSQDAGASMVGSFWIEAQSVTQERYRACVAAGACKPQPAQCLQGFEVKDAEPAVCVRWDDAQAFCQTVGRRLPTSDEWLVAVKGRAENGMKGLDKRIGEWLGSYYCAPELKGCGRARAVSDYDSPSKLVRYPQAAALAHVGFRCAWSSRPPASGGEPPPAEPLSAKTPGRIWCETTSCDATSQTCCRNADDGLGRCIPRTERKCGDNDIISQCDEQADCGAGQVCCPWVGCSGGCPQERRCQAPPCDSGDEVCLPGGTCQPGFRCTVTPGFAEASCTWTDVGASCGGTRCSGQKPVCCWDDKARKGTCSERQCKKQESAFGCTSPKDCGGSTCGQTQYYGDPNLDPDHLGFACAPLSHMTQAVLCSSMKDCPMHPPTGSKPKSCRHTADLPPGVKQCDYALNVP
ncbi:MAG: SUMF1/EgtB/PvdO family nonheme iron enzyme [Deltaproteobacteria bacterium]|nr:SUMF1/EgtB/PvdO family nonheme iron enzyme [Deltaproteobacteria bacterium]